MKHAFSLFYALIKRGFLANQSGCRVLSVLNNALGAFFIPLLNSVEVAVGLSSLL